MVILTGVILYLLVGIIAISVLDLITHRIRDKVRITSYEAQYPMVLLLVILVILWPLQLSLILYDAIRGKREKEKDE